MSALPGKLKHTNDGNCLKCLQILEQGGGTDGLLQSWFLSLQSQYPDLHVSCSVRGRIAQEAAYEKKMSKAHFGQSAHNYEPSLALDTFFLDNGSATWPKERYVEICGEYGENLPDEIAWLGRKSSPFPELPHFEIEDWKIQVKNNVVKLTDEE